MNKNNHKTENGAVLVVVAVSLVALLGISAFTVDIGYLQYQKRHLQNTADAASLAGAREYIDGDSSLENITKIVKDYVQLNGVNDEEVEKVTLSKKFESAENNAVTVDIKGNRDIFFGKIFGIQNSDIGVTATAIAAPVSGMKEGLLPFYFTEGALSNIEYGKIFDKFDVENPFNKPPGNWGTTSFFLTGQDVVNDWIQYGYDGKVVKIGDDINLKPGAGLNSIRNYLKYLKGNKYAIPIVKDFTPPGGGASQPGEVIGFIGIEVTDIGDKGANLFIEVKFLEMIAIGEIDPPTAPNYKLQALRLIE